MPNRNRNRNQPPYDIASLFPIRGSGSGSVEPKILRTHLEWNHLAGLYLWFHVVTPRCGETVIFFCTPKKGKKKQNTPNKKGTFVSKMKRKKQQWNMNTECIVYSLRIEILLEDGVSFFYVFLLQDDIIYTWFILFGLFWRFVLRAAPLFCWTNNDPNHFGNKASPKNTVVQPS